MRRGSGLLSPVVEFTGNGGKKVRFTSSIYRTEIPQKEGDRVEVLYDPVSDKMELVENAGPVRVGLIIPFVLCILGSFSFYHPLFCRCSSSFIPRWIGVLSADDLRIEMQ